MASRIVQEIKTVLSVGGVSDVTGAAQTVTSAVEAGNAAQSRSYSNLQRTIKASVRAAAAAQMAQAQAMRATLSGDRMAIVSATQRWGKAAQIARDGETKVRKALTGALEGLSADQSRVMQDVVDTAEKMMAQGVHEAVAYQRSMHAVFAKVRAEARETDAATPPSKLGIKSRATITRTNVDVNAVRQVASLYAASLAMKSASASAKEMAASQGRLARSTHAATGSILGFSVSARHGFHEIVGGVSEVSHSFDHMLRTSFRVFRVAIRVARVLAREIHRVSRALIGMGTHAVTASIHMGSHFLSGAVHAVRALAKELAHVLVQLGKIAVHQAVKWGTRAAAVYGLASAAVNREAYKSVTDSNAGIEKERGEAAANSMPFYRYQELQNLAKNQGVAPEALFKALDGLRDTITKANADPNSPEAQLFKDLRTTIYARDAQGHLVLRQAEDVYKSVAANLHGRYMDEAHMSAVYTKLFGSLDSLAIKPVTNRVGAIGEQAYAEGDQRAMKFGTYVSSEDLARSQEFTRTINDLKESIQGVKMEISRNLTPYFSMLAKMMTSFALTYRSSIGSMVARHVKGTVANIALLERIIDKETGIFTKMQARANQGVANKAWDPTLIHVYVFYLNHVKQHLINIAAAARKVSKAVGEWLKDHDLGSLDLIVVRLGHVERELEHFAERAKHYAREFWNALARGDEQGSPDSKIITKLAQIRNVVVAYLTKVKADILDVWKNGENADTSQTIVGQLAKGILYLYDHVGGWFTTIKTVIKSGVDLGKSLWEEFMKVLGKGPGERGESSVFTWMNTLISIFDNIVTRFKEAYVVFETMYAWVNKIFEVFGGDLGETLLVVSLLRMTGILGMVGGGFKAFFGVIEIGTRVVAALGAAFTGGGVMAAIRSLVGMGVIGGAAGESALAAAAAGGGVAAAGGLGVAGSLALVGLPAAALAAEFYNMPAQKRAMEDQENYGDDAKSYENNPDYLVNTLMAEINKVKDKADQYYTDGRGTDSWKDAVNRELNENLSPRAKAIAQSINLNINGDNVLRIDEDGLTHKVMNSKYDISIPTSTVQ